MRLRTLGLFAISLTAAACGGGSAGPAAGPEAPAEAGARPPTGSLPPTKSDGTPYVWKNVTILGGGYVTGVVYSPAKAGVVYARTDVGGAYRLNPTDKSWIPLTDHFNRQQSNYVGVESLAVDPSDANKVYLAVGTYTQDWAGNGAILRSNDQGNTWERTDVLFKMGGNENGRGNGERLAVDPNDGKILFFGSRKNGLWKSTDAGVTFKKVDSFPVQEDKDGLGIPFVVFDKASGQKGKASSVIFAGVSRHTNNFFKSTDGGATWKPVPNAPTKVMPTKAIFDSTGALFLSYGDTPGPGEMTTGSIQRFEPSKNKWTDITPLKPSAEDKFGYGSVAVDWSKPGTLLATTLDRWTKGDEVFRTTDGGKTWKPLFEGHEFDTSGAQYLFFGRDKLGKPHWIGDIDIDPFNRDNAMFVMGAGIWAVDDLTAADAGKKVHWIFRNQGLEETVATDLISPPVGPQLLSGVGDICGFYHKDLDKPTPTGMHMPTCNAASSIDVAGAKPELAVRVGTLWGEGAHGFISEDTGVTWKPFKSEPKGADKGGMIAISANGQSIVWSTKGSTPHFSKDRGTSWAPTKGLPVAVDTASWVAINLRPMADRVNPKKMYVFDSEKGHVYVSDDGGENFEATAKGLPGLPDYSRAMGQIEAVPGIEGDVWVSTGKDVYRSTDWGVTFNPIGTVDESYAIGFGKGPAGSGYPSAYLVGKVGGVYGFFRSDDAGATWVRINDDQHQYGFVGHITGDARVHGRAYIGTGGRGILYGEPKK
jgi:xyloglucan-specific exo-beta-1,4-glucanase